MDHTTQTFIGLAIMIWFSGFYVSMMKLFRLNRPYGSTTYHHVPELLIVAVSLAWPIVWSIFCIVNEYLWLKDRIQVMRLFRLRHYLV